MWLQEIGFLCQMEKCFPQLEGKTNLVVLTSFFGVFVMNCFLSGGDVKLRSFKHMFSCSIVCIFRYDLKLFIHISFTFFVSHYFKFITSVGYTWLLSVMNTFLLKLQIRCLYNFWRITILLSIIAEFIEPYINSYCLFVQALFWQQQNYYGVDLTPLHGSAFHGYFSQVCFTCIFKLYRN